MMRILAFFLEGFKEQIVGKKPITWTAYTRTGKVVLIRDNKVLKVFDPQKQPFPRAIQKKR